MCLCLCSFSECTPFPLYCTAGARLQGTTMDEEELDNEVDDEDGDEDNMPPPLEGEDRAVAHWQHH
jgi:hypothetical protein